jgi:hypothetical protein
MDPCGRSIRERRDGSRRRSEMSVVAGKALSHPIVSSLTTLRTSRSSEICICTAGMTVNVFSME